jgi:hypothetical protein
MSEPKTETENRPIAESAPPDDKARVFHAAYKEWADMLNELIERHGVLGSITITANRTRQCLYQA